MLKTGQERDKNLNLSFFFLARLLASLSGRPSFLFGWLGLIVGLAIVVAISTRGEVIVGFECKLRCILVRSRILD